ncbi:DUF2690 domain-containing protein [Kitasatospora sp. NPDC058170]|uniref:helix-turn-helix domain-containing protein n=1 Tax=Kitasatospora sp. NPDC058170 TaxID=3346364 RepID=UPI0036DD7E65
MASAWKQLPDELSDPARRLTEELRAIKDAAGLSLSELATRTHYSRASWERWLNGKRVVTEQALDALIGTVECDGPTLRALWAEAAAPEGVEKAPAEAASEAPVLAEPAAAEADAAPEAASEAASEAAAEPAPGPAPAVGPAAGTWWRRPLVLVTAAVAVLALLVLTGVRLSGGAGEAPAAVAQPVPTPTASQATPSKPAAPAPAVPGCQAIGCSHKDPKTTGCGADARTLQTVNIGKVVVYLRYSQKCQAAWAAITEGAPGDTSTVTTSAGEVETALIHWGYDNYSAMVNAADPGTTFQVCGHQPEPVGDACTVTVTDLANLVASTPIPIGPASPPPAAAAPSPSSS